jgi:hypothetical protein
MADSVTVEGAARLSRTLDHAADDLGKLDTANTRAPETVAAAARARAPRRTGTLAGSVRAESGEGMGRVVVDAPYAGYVEYGVPSHRIAARPFLAEAVEQTGPAVVDVYADDVARVVSQVKGA